MSTEGAVRYAGFWIRLAASVLDSIILSFVGGVFGAIMGFIIGLTSSSIESAESAVFFWGCLLGLAINIIYVIVFWTWRGQTPGKMIVGIQIVRNDGSSISIGRAFLRYLGYIVSTLIIYIGYLMIAWDGKKQGLHDKIADTIVIRVR